VRTASATRFGMGHEAWGMGYVRGVLR